MSVCSPRAFAQSDEVLSLSLEICDFGQVEIGRSATRALTITNTTSGVVTGTVLLPSSPFFIENGAGAFTLAAGASLTIELAFDPVIEGLVTDVCLISYVQVGVPPRIGTISVLLRGTGVKETEGNQAEIEVSTRSINFGEVRIGDNARRTLTITNTSTQAEVSIAINLSGAGYEATVDGFTSSEVRVPANGARQVVIEFEPTAAGRFDGTLRLTPSIQGNTGATVEIGLLGRGVEPDDGVNALPLQISLNAVDFGEVRPGSTVVRTIVLINPNTPSNGSMIDVNVGTPTQGSFNVTGGGSVRIGPGGTHVVTLAFTPNGTGPVSGILPIGYTMLDSNGASQGGAVTVNVSLSGSGSEGGSSGGGAMVVSTAAVDFGQVPLGGSNTVSFTIRNDGEDPMGGTVSIIGGTQTGPFEIISGSGGFTLQPGSQHTVMVRFAPIQQGTFSSGVLITPTSSGSQPATVLLVGAGVAGGTTDADEITVTIREMFLNSRPNPLVDRGEIFFRVPFSGPTTLTLYNVRGEIVQRLFDNVAPTGEQSVVLDATDLESGLYLLRMTNSGRETTQRIVVSK